MFKRLRIYVVCIVWSISLHAQNKILYLISPPRTLSTVLLRWMQARGDMIVYNEPSQFAFMISMTRGAWPNEYRTDIPFKTYAEVKKTILDAREIGTVFVKDPTCAAYASLYDDVAFLSDPDIEFCFVIRDPHASLVSYYKAIGLRYRDPKGFAWTVERPIYEYHCALFNKIKELRGKAPLVISSEELAEHPETILPIFCERAGIAFNDSMLFWPSLENSFDPLEWHEYKTLTACYKWHNNAIISTHFKSCVRLHDVDEFGQPTFTEFDPKYKEVLKDIYAYYMRFYTKMYAYRIR